MWLSRLKASYINGAFTDVPGWIKAYKAEGKS